MADRVKLDSQAYTFNNEFVISLKRQINKNTPWYKILEVFA